MLFKRTSSEATGGPRFPGRPEAIDGLGAVAAVERIAGEAFVLDAVLAERGLAGALEAADRETDGPVAAGHVRVAERGTEVGGLAAGFTATGLRTAIFAEGPTLEQLRASVAAAEARRLAFVVHGICGPDHDAFAAMATTGAFQLFAGTVQQAADYTLIGRYVTERALVPGICAQEGLRTAEAIQSIRLPERTLVDDFLGRPDDDLPCPTPAQQILFGPRRRRLPELFALDDPAGMGAALDAGTMLQADAARNRYFNDHLAGLIDEAMAAYGERTGRLYHRVGAYRMEDAEYVVLAQGAVVEDLKGVVHYLRQHEHIRAGVVDLAVLRPFPGDVLSHLLVGRKAVTVLECTRSPAADQRSLVLEVRGVLDRAAENGAFGASPPHPAYASIVRAADRPRVLSGSYGGGGAFPSFEDLCEVVRNMRQAGVRRSTFYLGARLDLGHIRLPGLERLQQLVRRGYPGIGAHALRGRAQGVALEGTHGMFQLRVSGVWEGRAAGRLLARALFHGLDRHIVEARPRADEAAPPDAFVFEVAHAEGALPPAYARAAFDAVLASGAALLGTGGVLTRVREGGAVVVHASGPPERLWTQLSPEARRAVRERKLHVYALDTSEAARAVAPVPAYASVLEIEVLLGAFLQVYPRLDDDQRRHVLDAYRNERAATLAGQPVLREAMAGALVAGSTALAPFDVRALPEEETARPEPEAPWPVHETVKPDGRLSDLVRFWNDVGFPRKTGALDQMLADPFVATGIMPPRSSPFRSVAARYHELPRLIAERCSACGACWSVCPDAALPVTVQSVGALVETAVSSAEAAGHELLQLRRILPHLIKQAHRLADADDLYRYRTAGALLEDALVGVVARAGLQDDQCHALEAAFRPVLDTVAALPLVKTDTFFRTPEKAEKGRGLLFALTVDPDACRACGLCVAVCPENALEMKDRTDAILADERSHTRFLRSLPEVPIEQIDAFISDAHPETLRYHQLNRRAHQVRLGGGHGTPGDGVRATLRLVLAEVEAEMQPRVATLVDRLGTLIERVDAEVHRRLASVVHVNDLDAFGRQLASLGDDGIGLDTLAKLTGEGGGGGPLLGRDALARLTNVRVLLKDLHARYTEAAHGAGRARMAAVLGGEAPGHERPGYPYNPYPFPWMYHLGDDAPAVAEGLLEGLMCRMAETFRAMRLAELYLDDTYDAGTHAAFFERFNWHDFSEEEAALCPPLLVVTDRESIALHRLLRGSLPVKVLLINAQPGVDAAATAPALFAGDSGLTAVLDGHAFVVQSTLGFPGHLLSGVRAGLSFNGPALFHFYAPDPAHHGVATERVVAHARAAVESRAFPLFTCDPRRGEAMSERLSLDGNPDVDADWGTQHAQVPGPNGQPVDLAWPLTAADWAAREGRFRAYFRLVPHRDWCPEMKPLDAFVALPSTEREGHVPYVQLAGADDRMVRKVVSPEMVRATEVRLRAWRRLLEMAGVRSALADRYAGEVRCVVEHAVAETTATLTAAHERALADVEDQHARRYHAMLTEQLLILSGYGPGTGREPASLRGCAAMPPEETP